MPPHFTFSLIPAQQIGLLTYLLASLLIVWGADHYRRLTQSLEDEEKLRKDEEKFRKLAVDELAHRLKNKLATIQSIISFQLRDDPQIRDAILSRLTALSATDDLIMATQNQGGCFLTAARVLASRPRLARPTAFSARTSVKASANSR